MAPTIVLITGANRGIGKGLLEKYLARPNHTVIGTVRDPDHELSKALASLPKANGSSLVLIKFDITVKTDGLEAVKQLETQGIDHLDVIIANAGVCFAWPKVSKIKVEDIEGHYMPNVHSLIFTYQATLPLLKKSKNSKWITISSSYSTSKVVAHWLTKAIHREEPELVAFPIDPGWVQTDLGNNGAHYFGHEQAPLKVEDVTEGIVKVVDSATRDSHGGKLIQWDGVVLPW
ncbi:aflatoxin biosynthesis ketoreductase nor-1 [Colletotrichum asianum]|uniref:Aflatoxin biosynthesis ketoreductase nor-1 n=1 Tax=Colletotrichum asianum TaxID=702518 RepID=A0A8H3ZE96_9PEZI|nr:aflatoxin biosynthesis ketoreductase nor-1 [Colletotrichum asianum]